MFLLFRFWILILKQSNHYQKELEKQLNILGIMKPYLGKAEELRSFENLNLYYKINSTLSELLLKFIYPPQIYFPY
jgi:hypothetical protein